MELRIILLGPLDTEMKLEFVAPPRQNEVRCETLGEVCEEFRYDVDQREKFPPPPAPPTALPIAPPVQW